MAYRTVDWRNKVRGCTGWSNIGSQNKNSGKIAGHYNGPGTLIGRMGSSAGDAEVRRQIEADADYQMVTGRYSPGFKVNGVMYHVAIHEDTVYILRNFDAVVWHAADKDYNYNALSFTFLVGENQTVSSRTLQTAKEFCDAELKRQGATSRRNVVGHLEVSDTGTKCPGWWLMHNFIKAYRAGSMGPSEKPGEKWDLAKYTFVSGGAWAEERVKTCVDLINTKAGKRISRWTGRTDRAVYASQIVYESTPVKAKVLVVCGTEGPNLLSPDAKSVFGKYSKSESDIWDATENGEIWEAMGTIQYREGLVGIQESYNKKYGGNPKGNDPTPPPKPKPIPAIDVGPYHKDSVNIASKFFQSFGKVWRMDLDPETSPIVARAADTAGGDLALVYAVAEQESLCRRIFGADWGTEYADRIPFAHLPVTKRRVDALIHHTRNRGVSNGVDVFQATYAPLLWDADKMNAASALTIEGIDLPPETSILEKAEVMPGGASNLENTARVCLNLLFNNIKAYGYRAGIGAYNAGPANPNYAYADSVIRKHEAWKKRLAK